MSSAGSSAVVTENAGQVGLGYGIAIAVGLLVLVSTIMLASYVCVRIQGRAARTSSERNHSQSQLQSGTTEDLPSSVNVVAEDESGACFGLDQGTINSYPKVMFSRKQQMLLPRPHDTCCAICLAEYKGNEMLRIIPECRHNFHVKCIDQWLKLNASCPLCRTSPLPSPISTPLAELIPLAWQAR